MLQEVEDMATQVIFSSESRTVDILKSWKHRLLSTEVNHFIEFSNYVLCFRRHLELRNQYLTFVELYLVWLMKSKSFFHCIAKYIL